MRERVEATCILVLILIEQLTTCYIWLTLYVKEEITNSTRCNMNKQNNENRPLHFMKKKFASSLYTIFSLLKCLNSIAIQLQNKVLTVQKIITNTWYTYWLPCITEELLDLQMYHYHIACCSCQSKLKDTLLTCYSRYDHVTSFKHNLAGKEMLYVHRCPFFTS